MTIDGTDEVESSARSRTRRGRWENILSGNSLWAIIVFSVETLSFALESGGGVDSVFVAGVAAVADCEVVLGGATVALFG